MGTGSYDSNHSNEVMPHPRFSQVLDFIETRPN